jgi:hypothetical protein
MADEDSRIDFWSMHSSQLRDQCIEIADAPPPGVDPALRAEAHQLAIEWQEAIEMPQHDLFEKSRRESEISALRKRTIEILVDVYGND